MEESSERREAVIREKQEKARAHEEHAKEVRSLTLIVCQQSIHEEICVTGEKSKESVGRGSSKWHEL